MTTFTTTDGRQVFIRRIRDNDTALLVGLFYRSSEGTRRLRFHGCGGKCPEELVWREATRLSQLDPERQVALAAIIRENDGEHIVGVARFARSTPNNIEAEIGIVVRDDYQRVGLGSHLMLELTQVARSMGIIQFRGWVLPENRQMLKMINKAGLPTKYELSMGETQVVVSIDKKDI
jgi:acetyltransferase